MQVYSITDSYLFMTDEVRLRLSEILQTAQGDLSVRKFAKEFGVSHVTLGAWIDCSAFPERESLEKIAAVLGRSLEDLLTDIRGDLVADISPKKAEDLLPLTNNLSDAEALRLATLLLERVNKAIASKL
jgi:transcriptional regulator with XRE-family HTH domain